MPGISSLINQLAREMEKKGTDYIDNDGFWKSRPHNYSHTCMYCGTIRETAKNNCPNCGAPPKEK